MGFFDIIKSIYFWIESSQFLHLCIWCKVQIHTKIARKLLCICNRFRFTYYSICSLQFHSSNIEHLELKIYKHSFSLGSLQSILCAKNLLRFGKCFPQMLHGCFGFCIPMCVSMWAVRLPFTRNEWLQMEHICGLTPSCSKRCSFKWPGCYRNEQRNDKISLRFVIVVSFRVVFFTSIPYNMIS